MSKITEKQLDDWEADAAMDFNAEERRTNAVPSLVAEVRRLNLELLRTYDDCGVLNADRDAMRAVVNAARAYFNFTCDVNDDPELPCPSCAKEKPLRDALTKLDERPKADPR